MAALTDLAAIITTEAQRISEYLDQQQLPQPSFSVDGPGELPIPPEDETLKASQRRLLAAAEDLVALTLGPVEQLRWQAWNQFNSNISLHAILRFRLAEAVPDKGGITFAEVSKISEVPEAVVTRALRHAMLSHIFCEPEPGVVAHTASSLALRNNQSVRDWIDMTFEEWGPAAVKTVDALTQFPDSEEPNQTGFGLAFNNQTIFQYLAERPERSKVFGGAMANFSKGTSHKVEHFVHGYDWKSLGKGTVVDIGGSHGHISLAVAKEAPELRFIVQDLPGTAADGEKLLDPDFKDRITFMGHDMNNVQPIFGASVYMFRSVLLNWPKKYCVKFIKNLIPALKPGSKVIINEGILPEPGTLSRWEDRIVRSLDLCMVGMFNSNERTVEEWKEIFALADERFKFQGVTRPNEASLLWIIEVVWDI